MKFNQVPVIKIGTPFQRPSWRYDAALNPHKYGFDCYISELTEDAGFAKRLVSKGVKPSEVYTYPEYFKELSRELTRGQSEMLEKTWNKSYFRNRKRKLSFSEALIESIPISWNITKLDQLNDDYLKKLIYHLFDYVCDDDIARALEFGLSESNAELKRWLGYAFFVGMTDIQVAKRWRLNINRVKAIRMLFFDFSHLPSDPIASWSIMRQLAENSEIDEADFSRYKEMRSLGEVGLKFITVGFDSLEPEEKRVVEKYMSNSTMTNAVELKMSMRTKQDALAYNTLMMNFARLSLFREEIRNKETGLRLMELQIKKAQKDLNIIDDGVYQEDLNLLDQMKEISKFDHTPKFKTFTDLVAENSIELTP